METTKIAAIIGCVVAVLIVVVAAFRSKKMHNENRDEKKEDATALIRCSHCGAMIVITDIPIPAPRQFQVRCKKCDTVQEMDLDDFTSLRIEE